LVFEPTSKGAPERGEFTDLPRFFILNIGLIKVKNFFHDPHLRQDLQNQARC
jgi:hypothetical protein